MATISLLFLFGKRLTSARSALTTAIYAACPCSLRYSMARLSPSFVNRMGSVSLGRCPAGALRYRMAPLSFAPNRFAVDRTSGPLVPADLA